MCNGDVSTIQAFFTRLDLHLENSSEPVPLEFYSDVVSLTEHGKTLQFRTSEMGPHAYRLPTEDDWREISRRGLNGLQGAGYRGCFFSSGKAWFDINVEDGRFALKGFDKDRAWSSD